MKAFQSCILIATFCCIIQNYVSLADGKNSTEIIPTSTSSTTVSGNITVPTTQATPTVEVNFPDNIGSWNVTDTSINSTCIMMTSAIQLSINYIVLGEKNSTYNKIAKLDVPINATSKGNCIGTTQQELTLSWNNEDSKSKPNTIHFVFNLNEDKNQTIGNFSIETIEITVYKNNLTFPNATDADKPLTLIFGENPMFITPLNNSYRCKASYQVNSVNLTNSINFQNSQIEAFRKVPLNNTEFSKEYICSADTFNVAVFSAGIVFAIILGLIILGALIGGVVYFIRKKRAQTGTGYENM